MKKITCPVTPDDLYRLITHGKSLHWLKLKDTVNVNSDYVVIGNRFDLRINKYSNRIELSLYPSFYNINSKWDTSIFRYVKQN